MEGSALRKTSPLMERRNRYKEESMFLREAYTDESTYSFLVDTRRGGDGNFREEEYGNIEITRVRNEPELQPTILIDENGLEMTNGYQSGLQNQLGQTIGERSVEVQNGQGLVIADLDGQEETNVLDLEGDGPDQIDGPETTNNIFDPGMV